jgi:hypothetical protein
MKLLRYSYDDTERAAQLIVRDSYKKMQSRQDEKEHDLRELRHGTQTLSSILGSNMRGGVSLGSGLPDVAYTSKIAP